MPDHDLVGGVAVEHGGNPSSDALCLGHYQGVAAAERPGAFVWPDYRRALLGAAGVPDERLDAASHLLAAAMAGPALSVWSTRLPGAGRGTGPVATEAQFGDRLQLRRDRRDAARRPRPLPGRRRPGVEMVAIVDSGAVGVAKPMRASSPWPWPGSAAAPSTASMWATRSTPTWTGRRAAGTSSPPRSDRLVPGHRSRARPGPRGRGDAGRRRGWPLTDGDEGAYLTIPPLVIASTSRARSTSSSDMRPRSSTTVRRSFPSAMDCLMTLPASS